MTVNGNQSVASIARQILAILGIVFGVLTQSIGSLHLPVAVSSILTIGGAVILAVEHYVSDPSTGTPAPPKPTIPPA
jgi:tetrahydromethanopterin S-methyltransferase subunit C